MIMIDISRPMQSHDLQFYRCRGLYVKESLASNERNKDSRTEIGEKVFGTPVIMFTNL